MVNLVKEINIKVYSNGTTEVKEVACPVKEALDLKMFHNSLKYFILATKVMKPVYSAMCTLGSDRFSKRMMKDRCSEFYTILKQEFSKLKGGLEGYMPDELGRYVDYFIQVCLPGRMNMHEEFAQLVVGVVDPEYDELIKSIVGAVSRFCVATGYEDQLQGVLAVLFDDAPYTY